MMSRLSIWLVEDNPADAFVVEQALREHHLDFDLTVSANRHDISNYLDGFCRADQISVPDLILLDLNLPGITGVEVLEALRQTPKCAGVPVIVVTSSDSDRDRSRVAPFGIAHYFRKPVDLDEYLSLGEIVKRFAVRD
jgi:CheY-like chemotaxis protein